MNNLHLAAARKNKLIRAFNKNHELVQEFTKQYSGCAQDEIEENYHHYKKKLTLNITLSTIFLAVGIIVIFSSIGFYSDDGSMTKVIALIIAGAIIGIIGSFFSINHTKNAAAKKFLEYKLESFNEENDYDINDIKDLKYYKLRKFLDNPPQINSKYDFLCGVYVVHCLHLPYDKSDKLPFAIMSGLGFRYDAALVADKIKSDWKEYKKSNNYDGSYLHMFDHLTKYNINFKSLRFTFIENTDYDLEEAEDYWYSKLDPNEKCWFS